MLSQILRTKHRRFIGYHHDVINNVGQTINCKGENLHAICAYANDNSKNVEAIESQGGTDIGSTISSRVGFARSAKW